MPIRKYRPVVLTLRLTEASKVTDTLTLVEKLYYWPSGDAAQETRDNMNSQSHRFPHHTINN